MKKNDIQLSFQDLTQYANQFNLDLQKDLAVTFTPHAMYTCSGAYELDSSIYETFKRCVDYTLEYFNASTVSYPPIYTNLTNMAMRDASIDVLWNITWRPFVNSIFSASYTWARNIFDYIIEYMDDHKVDSILIRNVPAAFDINHVVDRNKFFDDNYINEAMAFGSLLSIKDCDTFFSALYEKFAPLIEMRVFNLMLNCYNSMRAAIADITTDILDVDNPDAVSDFMTIIDSSFNTLMKNSVTETAIFIKNIEGLIKSISYINNIKGVRLDSK